ncbi:MAG: endonuclease/exonuclease/phosphatase family protein [Pseudomonadota bacterium]
MRIRFRLRYAAIALALMPGLLLMAVLWMAGGLQPPKTFEAAVTQVDALTPTTPHDTQTLRLLIWNVAWGYGEGSAGAGPKKPKEHFEQTMAAMAAVVREASADIVLLQEIDFDATRSYHQNQARAIAEAAGLPYVAEAVSWRANWVPFPYWPPADHFGRMSSGGAILSRFPLSDHRVELLPKPESNAPHYNLFYLFRYAQEVKAATPLGEVQLLNLHLEAFDGVNRVRQAWMLAERLRGQVPALTVLAGDFNALPPEAPVQAGFVDQPTANFLGDETLLMLRSIGEIRDVVSARDYRRNPSAHYTFPSTEPSRTLDHALVGTGFEVREARVYHEAGELSDHLPLLVTLALTSSR